MPTHASKAKKEAMRGTIAPVGTPNVVAAAIAVVATSNIPDITSSAATVRERYAKVVEPSMQQTIKHEKSLPNGTETPAPKAALTAGGHCNTKMYMAPSNRACKC